MLKRIPNLFKNFYFLTAFLFVVWMIALDSNNVFTRFELSSKLDRLEDEQEYYVEKIEEVKKDHDELFGDRASLEKFAREKYLMKKESEDIFIVEETE
ncbi:MAG: septum formation initiator family protein [Chryseolinea sp.]